VLGQLVANHRVEVRGGGQILPRRRGVLAGRVDLGAVAGRHDDRLAGQSAAGQRLESRRHAARREVHPLAQIDGGGPMADADE
jgi:hypothetical protein